METEKNPLETVRALLSETLEKSLSATQSYIDQLEKTMRSLPGSSEAQVSAFKSYIERQVAANHAFVDKLLHTKDFQEALCIQFEYFRSQLKAATDDAIQLGARLVEPFKRSAG